MTPRASSPTIGSTVPLTFKFFTVDSLEGFSSILPSTPVAAAAFGVEAALHGGAATDLEEAGLCSGGRFFDDAFGVAVEEDGVGAGDNGAGRLGDGDGEEVTLLL